MRLQLRALFLVLPLTLATGLGAGHARAEAPRIVVSIAPVHSLAAMVADGISEPELLVPGNASPHTYSLRPSQARALARADLVIRIGPTLETFLSDPLATLAADAARLEIAALPGLVQLPARHGGIWGEHDHDHAAQKHEDGSDAEVQGALDPHVWLDPRNAIAILDGIAAALAEIDPDNTDRYRDNARLARTRIAALDAALAAKLRPAGGRPVVVFHDAYQYLEARYGLTVLGAVTVSPDIQPGARRLAELRAEIVAHGNVCIFAEPQFPQRLIEAIAGETAAVIGVLDPLGAAIEPGRDAYLTMMDEIGAAAVACIAAPA